ncbi:hypothetical protein D5F01_LYC00071 [Larimichthys crocea]|uniref:Reverse transcriptase domain-containing protein n=1 Tax=Larimichthys crocea TaxID=215358 RepID=A0A6G0J8M0_LARCR|nr:hypothetical protein D5F01_LYC00071 [Larimichthys crocea]
MSIHLMPKRRMQKRQSRPKLNIKRLGDSTYQEQLQAALSTDLPKQCPYDAEKHWGRLSSTIMNCSKSKWSDPRAVYSPSYSCLTPLRSKDGLKLLKDKEAITNRWKEHYEDLLNRNTTPEMDALEQLPQQPIIENMGEPPSLEEVQDAIKKMKYNKAAGPDGIPADVPKEGGPDLHRHIHALLLKIWQQEKILAQLRNALVVSIFKKGDKV